MLRELEEQIKGRKEVVCSGSCKTIEEYKALTGEIRGLSTGQLLLTDLVRKLENDDDS